MLDWLGKVPTTQARIVVTLILVLATAVRYLVWGAPSHMTGATVLGIDGWNSWLVFLAAMAGIDARAHRQPPAARPIERIRKVE